MINELAHKTPQDPLDTLQYIHTYKRPMTTLNLTQRQVTILGLALTVFYDEIAKTGRGQQMKDDIMEFSRYIQKQHNEEL